MNDTVKPLRFTLVLLLAILLLACSMFMGISFGAKDLTISNVWEAVFSYDRSSTAHQIIQEVRLPRVIAAALVGAAFAVAGALMQGVTRNPLADVGVLGINAGAMFVVALSFVLFPHLPFTVLMLLAFSGALASTAFIYLLGAGTPGGLTPMKLTLAGTVVAALLHSLTSGIAIYFELSQDLAYWYAGGVAGVEWEQLRVVLPVILVVLFIALILGRSISIIALGEEVATNLGVHIRKVRVYAIVFALLLAGVSVSAVGSIAFVGLVIPHIARKLVGVNYTYVIPMSAVLGSILLVLADLGARMADPPKELAIGVVVAIIGVPFFLYVARKERRNL
ncbi:FecCD family ABC transporter permease [Paenibacillus massiliensis]|uniref:FecCD family ABC transporter permease n=1 Tax=Paenibacillus massiliensis TaxID=225917 RepID=UPI000363E81E|nr:iron ABC transporter permease [Paenibacillus massiliensis]